MRVEIIRIGNSQGLRLPKYLLAQCGFDREVDIEIEAGCLIIKPHQKLRESWLIAFQAMHEQHGDQLLDQVYDIDIQNDEDWQ